MDKGSLELLLNKGLSVAQIGKRFGKDPSTISYWMEKHGLEAVNRERHAPKGGIARERLEELVELGMTIAEIAAEVGLSKGTVRHWMRRHGLRTQNARRIERVRSSKDDGLATVTLRCIHHGEAEFVIESRGYYRCKRCRSEGVARRRRRLKEILLAEAGGSCCVCGYDRYVGTLHFHHLDRREKRLEISGNGVTLSLAALRAEVSKCVLVCSNCHAELEAGVARLPDTVSASTAPATLWNTGR